MKSIRPRRKILVLAACAGICALAYFASYRPASAEHAEVQEILAEVVKARDAETAVELEFRTAASRLEQSQKALAEWTARFETTPSLEDVYERMEKGLQARGFALERFAPSPEPKRRIELPRLLLEQQRFTATFRVGFRDAVELLREWQEWSAALCLESVELAPADEVDGQVQVDLTCVLTRSAEVRPVAVESAKP